MKRKNGLLNLIGVKNKNIKHVFFFQNGEYLFYFFLKRKVFNNKLYPSFSLKFVK